MTKKAIVWIREDLRIENNPALSYASQNHESVAVLYIYNNKYFDKKEKHKNGGYLNHLSFLKIV